MSGLTSSHYESVAQRVFQKWVKFIDGVTSLFSLICVTK